MHVSENSVCQYFNYQTIPPEITSTIFSFNNLCDKINIAKVCTMWREVVQKEPEYFQLFSIVREGNRQLRMIITSDKMTVPRQISIPRLENPFMSSEIKYDRFDLFIYENRFQRAKRLQPEIEQLKETLNEKLHSRTTTKLKIVYSKDRFVLTLDRKQVHARPIECEDDIDCLCTSFRTILNGFLP